MFAVEHMAPAGQARSPEGAIPEVVVGREHRVAPAGAGQEAGDGIRSGRAVGNQFDLRQRAAQHLRIAGPDRKFRMGVVLQEQAQDGLKEDGVAKVGGCGDKHPSR